MNGIVKVCVLWGHLNGAFDVEPKTRWFFAAGPEDCDIIGTVAVLMNKKTPNISYYIRNKDWTPLKSAFPV